MDADPITRLNAALEGRYRTGAPPVHHQLLLVKICPLYQKAQRTRGEVTHRARGLDLEEHFLTLVARVHVAWIGAL